MAQQVLSITQINEYIRAKLDRDSLLSSVAVRGEVSNYKVYPSGHHYFTLKDESSSLRCVMFKGSAVKLRFKPENGMTVLVMGKISVYPRDGAYQLYCTAMVIDGVGDLYAAFEQLKAKLAAQGYFDPAHKKQLPQFPSTIGIVTSSAGAAIHDMLRILKKRYPLVKVKLLPVRVQGVEAPDEIAAAIRYANYYSLADLLIVGRGGGSIEDLWAFNDERVATAIYESEIPVISAVGHEPDVTISDYVADLRAATPSNAAELAVPDRDSLEQLLDSLHVSIVSLIQQKLRLYKSQLSVLASSRSLQGPDRYIAQHRERLTFLDSRLIGAEKQQIAKRKQSYISLISKLDAMSPLKVLSRGYSTVRNADGALIRSANQVHPGDCIRINLHKGALDARVTNIEEGKL